LIGIDIIQRDIAAVALTVEVMEINLHAVFESDLKVMNVHRYRTFGVTFADKP
jgi:hypothetical protein